MLQLEEPDRLGVGLEGHLRDPELLIQAPQLQVRVRHGANQRQDHPPPCVFGCQKARLSGFGQTADASPEIDLPTRARQHLVGRLRVGDRRRKRGSPVLGPPLPLRGAVVARLREQGCTGLDEDAGGLLDLGCRDLDVPVVRQRLVDQGIQDRVIKLAPPLRIGRVGRFLDLRAVCAGNGQVGSFVVGPHGATGKERGDLQGRREQEHRDGSLHVSPPALRCRHGLQREGPPPPPWPSCAPRSSP